MIRNLWRALLSLALLATTPLPTKAQELVAEGQLAGLKIEIRELKRDDSGMVTLRFKLINGRDKELPLQQFAEFIGDWGAGWVDVSAVHLIDGANRKKYLVVRDSAKKCVCARVSFNNLSAGGTLNLWAKFPAPPESVQKVSVMFPNFEPVDNVPIAPR
jgi:hypothetical protein